MRKIINIENYYYLFINLDWQLDQLLKNFYLREKRLRKKWELMLKQGILA